MSLALDYIPPPKRRPATATAEIDGQLVEVKSQYARAIAAGAQCLTCPLYAHDGIGPVFGEIVPGAKGAFIGEAPGRREIEEGRVFVGASGAVLDNAIIAAGSHRRSFTVVNTLLCMPPGGNLSEFNRGLQLSHDLAVERYEAGKGEHPGHLVFPSDACFPRMQRDLDASASKVLIPVGGEALRAVARYTGTPYGTQRVPLGTPKLYTIKKQHGSPLRIKDGRVIFPSLHPAFAMRGATTFAPIIEHDLIRATETALNDGRLDWTEPKYILTPDIATILHVLQLFTQCGALVTVDLETDSASILSGQIRCFGLGAVVDDTEIVIVVPWTRRSDGSAWWSPEDAEQIAPALRTMFDTCPLAGHNVIGFDMAILLRLGFLTDRRKLAFDTMIAHHDTRQSELPHDLGFVAARNFVAPRWKEDADQKHVAGEVDDLMLHTYCAKDVLGTMRLVPALTRQIADDGQVQAFLTDTELAPCARDMGVLGVNLNETKRRDFYEKLDAASKVHLAKLWEIIGPTYNPNSTKQLSRWLFVDRGLTPTYDTAGEEWGAEDGDDDSGIVVSASTSELALTTLLDRGVDDVTRTVIDEQLRYRGLRKIIGTYLGYRLDPDDGVLHDTFRERGMITEHEWEGHKLAVLHTKWGVHRIPSGRWNSTKPAMQVFPERVVYDVALYRKSGGDEGIINTREIVEAPPGHVMVGCDLARVEWKLYMIFSGDRMCQQADDLGLDDHSWNFASMMGRTPAEVQQWYGVMEKPDRTKQEERMRKHNRNIAKRVAYLCLPFGAPVLTDRGEIPIQDVAGYDRVWDGVEWVHHGGVIDKGEQEVIFHDGLWATAGHEVWTAQGQKVSLAESAARGCALARTGEGRTPLRFVEDDLAGLAGQQQQEASLGVLHLLRPDVDRLVRQPTDWKVERLPSVRARTETRRCSSTSDPGVVADADVDGASALHESGSSELAGLRRERDPVQVQVDGGSSAVDRGQPRAAPGAGDRSGEQRRSLRPGESALRNAEAAGVQHHADEAPRVVDLPTEGLAARDQGGGEEATRRNDAGADHRGSSGVRRAEAELVAPRRRTARVYDLLNAGPRHRFTVSGRLVSNCEYGGQEEKMFQTMSTERNPDGSPSFPGLTPDMVSFWYRNFHAAHPEMRQWQRRMVHSQYQRGYVESVIDRRKRFYLGGPDPTAIMNHPIQSSAADITNRAMKEIYRACPPLGWSRWSGPVFQLHDYIGLVVPEARAQEAADLLARTMTAEIGGRKIANEVKIAGWTKKLKDGTVVQTRPSWDRT